MLVAKPEREPRAIGSLGASEMRQSSVDGLQPLPNLRRALCHDPHSPLRAILHAVKTLQPARNSTERVRSQITAATIERQVSPAAAEGWPATVPVPQIHQPT